MSTITLVIRNVLEYEYFASYSSTRTQKVLVLEYEYEYTSTITPSLVWCHTVAVTPTLT